MTFPFLGRGNLEMPLSLGTVPMLERPRMDLLTQAEIFVLTLAGILPGGYFSLCSPWNNATNDIFIKHYAAPEINDLMRHPVHIYAPRINDLMTKTMASPYHPRLMAQRPLCAGGEHETFFGRLGKISGSQNQQYRNNTLIPPLYKYPLHRVGNSISNGIPDGFACHSLCNPGRILSSNTVIIIDSPVGCFFQTV